ncbi:MAG: response regulator [Chloroflexi bacterium]|nr:response regulator [Chloroflexota bacterium]
MKILVVDDHADNRRLISDLLSMRGYTVTTAVDGQDGLNAVQTQQPDLIILDVDMPRMDGFEVVKRLKASEKTAQVPILMLTARIEVKDRVEGLQLGAEDYLTKPFNARELLARVEARLRAKSETDELRKQKETIRMTFERFVSPSVVEELLRDPTQVKLGGKLQQITVLFADLENFTSTSEQTEPEDLLRLLNRYHTLIVRIVQEFGGTVDKFIGDAVMALYNTPLMQADHALRAVLTALKIREELVKFHEQLDPALRMKLNFGIHTGTAVVGNVGAQDVMDYTAVGDTVNIAARLQQMARGGAIYISQATFDAVNPFIESEKVGDLNVKGRSGTVHTYNVLRKKDDRKVTAAISS